MDNFSKTNQHTLELLHQFIVTYHDLFAVESAHERGDTANDLPFSRLISSSMWQPTIPHS
jgi:hypothetical protein